MHESSHDSLQIIHFRGHVDVATEFSFINITKQDTKQ